MDRNDETSNEEETEDLYAGASEDLSIEESNNNDITWSDIVHGANIPGRSLT
jgi:hypothetical protein